jgi:hypothetical protein
MVPPRDSASPYDSVREAFDGLRTSEKAAFAFEATFSALGQGLQEAGRRVATAVDDLDVESWFRPPPRGAGTPPPPPVPPTPPAAPDPPEPVPPPATS